MDDKNIKTNETEHKEETQYVIGEDGRVIPYEVWLEDKLSKR